MYHTDKVVRGFAKIYQRSEFGKDPEANWPLITLFMIALGLGGILALTCYYRG